MYQARKMLSKELQKSNNTSPLKRYCVEHENGAVVAANLTWTEACAEVRRLSERALGQALAALAL